MIDQDFYLKVLVPWLAIIGASTGVLAVFLHALNFHRQRKRDKVQLKVQLDIEVGSYTEFTDGTLSLFGLRVVVINNSHFDLTVNGCGIKLKHRVRTLCWMPLPDYAIRGGRVGFPCRIESRSSREVTYIWDKMPFIESAKVDPAEAPQIISAVYAVTHDNKRIVRRPRGLLKFKRLAEELVRDGTIRMNNPHLQ